MPYTEGDDLPKNVKKLTAKKKRQWIHVFNSALGAGKDEAAAFRMANGVVKEMPQKLTLKEMMAAGSLGHAMEARLHRTWTAEADYMYEDGMLTREERIGLSNAIGSALETFTAKTTAEVPALYERDRWASAIKAVKTEDEDEEEDEDEDEDDDYIPHGKPKKKKGFLPSLKELFSRTKAVNASVPDDGSVVFFKDAKGQVRFIARVSNNFQDRAGEIITEAAHKEAIEWIDQHGAYPELWIWHEKSLKAGRADWMAYADGFVTVSGVLDKDYEGLGEAFSKEDAPKIGMSHGFIPLETKGGLITKYRPFEVSVLPLQAACNPWTSFDTLNKEKEMGFPEEKRKFLLETVGASPEYVAALESSNESQNKALKALGVASKEDPDPKPDDEGESEISKLASQVKELAEVVGGQGKVLEAAANAINRLQTTITETKSADQQTADHLIKSMGQPAYNPKTDDSNVDPDITAPQEKQKDDLWMAQMTGVREEKIDAARAVGVL